MPDNRFLSRSFRNLLVVNWTPPPPPPYQENEPLLGRYRMPDHHAETRPLKNQAKIRLLVVLLFGVFIGYLTDRAYNFNNYEKLWLTWAKEEEHRTSVRSQWVAEFERHEVQRTRMEEEIVKWREEKAAMDTDRRMWEEERERQRVQLVWEDVEPGRCLSYAKREYKATLSNIGIGINGLAECSNKTLVIHGKGVLPDVCNIEGPCGRVTGHWTVDLNEAGCSPWWNTPADKGCEGSKRRYEAHLMDLQNKQDWEVLCKTTPMVIKGVSYDGAMSCTDWSLWGVYGTWFVDDKECY